MTNDYSDARRTFLKTVILFTGAAVAAPIAPKVHAAAKPVSQTKQESQGYRETPHIRKYYQTVRS